MRNKMVPSPVGTGEGSPSQNSGSPLPLPGEGRGVGASERRLITFLITLTVFVTCLPYAWGYFLAPVMGEGGHDSFFIGTAYNIDDYCNYLSWLRQMADGHFFLHNLFTTDAKKT